MAITPDFEWWLVKQYGDESIASAFLIGNTTDKTHFAFLNLKECCHESELVLYLRANLAEEKLKLKEFLWQEPKNNSLVTFPLNTTSHSTLTRICVFPVVQIVAIKLANVSCLCSSTSIPST